MNTNKYKNARFLINFFSFISLIFCFNCGDDSVNEKEDENIPHLIEILDNEVNVGETMFFYGHNVLEASKGITQIIFKGKYLRDDGVVEAVDFTITPLYDGEFEEKGDVLRLSRFGPYRIPFTEFGDKLGTFKGQIILKNITKDGEWIDPEPPTLTIRVQPSIIIEEFQPITADCGAPVLRALGGMPYKMRVRAVGFEPEFFQYTLAGFNGKEGMVEYTHKATASWDTLGDPDRDKDPMITNLVSDSHRFYVAAIRIIAIDANNDFIETALPITVHRPIEVFSDGKLRIAEYYEPVPVSGCIPGTLENTVLYGESISETRQKIASYTVSDTWMDSHTEAKGSNWTNGISEGQTSSKTIGESVIHTDSENTQEGYGLSYNTSESNNVNFSTTNGESWGWNMVEGTSNEEFTQTLNGIYGEGSLKVGAEGEAGVPLVAKGKVATEVGTMVGGKKDTTTGEKTGSSKAEGSHMDGSKSETNGYGSTTTDSKGMTMSGSYTLGTQDSYGKNISETEARDKSTTFTFGENVSESNAITKGITEQEQQTWSESKTSTVLMQYSGFIPTSRFGIFYRQTVRQVRTAQIYTYNLCGVKRLQGEMFLNEWTWAPELAIGDTCEPLPDSQLPAAKCLIPPCEQN